MKPLLMKRLADAVAAVDSQRHFIVYLLHSVILLFIYLINK